MKILLIGPTGMIGSRIMNEALSRGHEVTALVRETSQTGEHKPNLDYRTGDIFKPETVAAAAVDHDVVVSAYGPASGDASLVVKAAHSLVEALTRVEPIRLIEVSGAGSLEVSPGVQLVDTPDFPAAWKAIALAHRDALDVYRKAGLRRDLVLSRTVEEAMVRRARTRCAGPQGRQSGGRDQRGPDERGDPGDLGGRRHRAGAPLGERRSVRPLPGSLRVCGRWVWMPSLPVVELRSTTG